MELARTSTIPSPVNYRYDECYWGLLMKFFAYANRVTVALLIGAFGHTLPLAAQAQERASPAGTLETILVRAAREPIAVKAIGSAATLLDQSTLAQRQLAPLGEILRSVPGLAVSRVGVMGAQTQLRMRGSEANQVLVLIDGIRANDPAQNDEFNIAHVLNYDIESIEIIRGPQSALWGTDAMAGVIDIRTGGGAGSSRSSLFAETGSNNWQNIGARTGLRGDRWTASGSVNSLSTSGDNLSREGSEADGYENLSSNLGLRFEVSETVSLDASLRYTDARNEFDRIDFATGLPTDSANRTDVTQLYGQLSALVETLDGRWTHRLRYAHTATENSNRSENSFAPSGFNETRADADIAHLNYQSSFFLNENHRVTAALERQEQDFSQRGPASAFGDPNRDESISINSFIAEYGGELTSSLSLLLSARHDANSDFRDASTGRASVAWHPFGETSGTKLRASYGTGVKNPTFTDRFGFFTNFAGNPDLKPETSRGWDAGIDQRLLDNRLSLSATWFEARLEDEINGLVFDPDSGGFTSANEDGRSDRRGLEVNGAWQVAPGLDLSVAYTWLDATEQNAAGDNLREIRRPRHVASGNLNWQFLGDRATLNINVDYNGVQDDFFFPPVPPFQERVSLEAFTLVTLATSYQFTRRLQLFARVENALDENYEEVFGFASMGHTAYAGVRYRFAD